MRDIKPYRHYVVTGCDRAVGALGLLELFETCVFAPSEDEARDAVYTARYEIGREHVHLLHVCESDDCKED